MTSFKVRTAEYNTSDLQNLGASLSQFIITPSNTSPIQTTTITLTPTQLNNFSSTTPIKILNAPGVNKYYILYNMSTELQFNTGATPYNSLGGLSTVISYDTAGTIDTEVSGSGLDNTLTQTSSTFTLAISAGFIDPPILINSVLNSPIYLYNPNNPGFSGGTSNVKLTMNYSVVTYP
jgi:hypothetical protein